MKLFTVELSNSDRAICPPELTRRAPFAVSANPDSSPSNGPVIW